MVKVVTDFDCGGASPNSGNADTLDQAKVEIKAVYERFQEASPHDCGINRTYLSSVERSKRNISIDNIARIARRLQIEPWRLLKDE